METVSFGRTGLRVSKLCFGTMGVGTSKWKPWVLDEADSIPLLKRCLDLGITFFDMANWYSLGESERIVGKTLLSMVPRDELVLTTKAHYAMSDNPNDKGLSRKKPAGSHRRKPQPDRHRPRRHFHGTCIRPAYTDGGDDGGAP